MGEDSDITELIETAQKARAVARRNTWLYGALVFIVNLATTLVVTTWTVRGAFDDFKVAIRDVVNESKGTATQLHDVGSKVETLKDRVHDDEIKTEANRVCCLMVQSNDSHQYRKPGSANP